MTVLRLKIPSQLRYQNLVNPSPAEVPEEIKDMLFVKGISSAEDVISEMPRGEIDKLILEAYRRGLKAGK